MTTATLQERYSKDEADIRALIGAIHQAHHDKDAAAIVAKYTEDAPIFDLAPPLYHRGMNRQELAAWLDTWEGPVDIESRDLRVHISGDLAFCHGLNQVSATTKAGGERAVFWIRATICLRKTGSTWRIVHEHTSVPFYMDGSFRAATDLQP
ncbi:YybH family protein [Pyxidicoccus xibeiensis]|uniref:YybH family protein n=1 Tax=Pyxidicoccus xibeiensis TaxID=2906759 RepID=UPI0020A7FACE|nr:nuclear transport factor 2 family protein [Pyxidicoccus xibeiensis]MCP3141721.1 nuclear transport factor 2 family protein [Pyxidicoccus xibeiensis]